MLLLSKGGALLYSTRVWVGLSESLLTDGIQRTDVISPKRRVNSFVSRVLGSLQSLALGEASCHVVSSLVEWPTRQGTYIFSQWLNIGSSVKNRGLLATT